MRENVIYHNPRCSKSRATLALLQERDADVQVVQYLESPPAVADLRFVCDRLGVSPLQIFRTKEKRFRELGLAASDQRSDDEWLGILAENPVLLERPIVVYRDRVAIGRSPENVLEILG